MCVTNVIVVSVIQKESLFALLGHACMQEVFGIFALKCMQSCSLVCWHSNISCGRALQENRYRGCVHVILSSWTLRSLSKVGSPDPVLACLSQSADVSLLYHCLAFYLLHLFGRFLQTSLPCLLMNKDKEFSHKDHRFTKCACEHKLSPRRYQSIICRHATCRPAILLLFCRHATWSQASGIDIFHTVRGSCVRHNLCAIWVCCLHDMNCSTWYACV